MKKQNIIIFGVFVLILTIFYLVSCSQVQNEEEVLEEQTPVIEETPVVEEVKKYVDIVLSGELERTGKYNVPAHWTLKMLFDYAGVSEFGDISNYTLSDLVTDGMTYNVPNINDKNVESILININTATLEELTSIPGIGDIIAGRIISYRETMPFTSTEDIKNVSGIGDSMYEKIKDYITI